MCLPEQSARDAALAELARLDPTVLDAASLMGQITELARFISQAQGQLSRLTATLDATGGAAEAGHTSAAAFLRTQCGLAPGRAAAVVATARGLRGLEATGKALNAGEISFDQAHSSSGRPPAWVRRRARRRRCYLRTRPGWTPPGSGSSPPRWPTARTPGRRRSGRSAGGRGGTCPSG